MSSSIVCTKPLGGVRNGDLRPLKYPVALFLIVLAVSVTTFVVLDCTDEVDANATIDGLEYNLNSTSRTARVEGYTGSSQYVCIPSSITYDGVTYSVTSIGDSAFDYCRSLASVIIGNSVTSIESWAFRECTSLASVTIGDSVKSIGGHAFDGCIRLSSVIIPNSVTSIGDNAFAGCTRLSSVTIGNSVKSIGGSAFWQCTSLASLTIPDSVTSIGNHAFRTCTSLKSLVIPISLDQVNYRVYPAFSGCTDIQTVTFTQGTGVGYDYSSTYQYTPWYFSKDKCTEISLSDGITSIGKCAFYNSASLSSLTIPSSVTSLGEGALYLCTSLTSITVDERNQNYSSEEGVLFTKNKTQLIQYPVGNSRISYTIPDSVTTIENYAFSGCTSLSSVTIPASVTSLGYDAFSGCTSLSSVTIPNLVVTIRNYAFSGCTSLSSVTIGNSVKSIGKYAFSGCTSLSSLIVPGSVTSLGEGAFSGTTFYRDGAQVDPTVNVLKGRTWIGTGNGKLYSYSPSDHLTVAFCANGGSSDTEMIDTGADHRLVSIPSATRHGFNFAGWYTQIIGGDIVTTSYVFTQDTTVYAHWIEEPVTYTVTFNANGGTPAIQSRTTGDDGKISSLPTASRYGFTFDGWYTQATGGEKVTTSYVFTQNTTVYAHWTESPSPGTYTVTFDANGGSCDTRTMETRTDGRLSSLPAALRDRYAFDGWYTQATGGEKISTAYRFTDDATVYAHWTKSSSSGDGIPVIAIVGAVIAVIAVAGAVVFIRKR